MVVLQVDDSEVVDLALAVQTTLGRTTGLQRDVIGVRCLAHRLHIDLNQPTFPLHHEVGLP